MGLKLSPTHSVFTRKMTHTTTIPPNWPMPRVRDTKWITYPNVCGFPLWATIDAHSTESTGKCAHQCVWPPPLGRNASDGWDSLLSFETGVPYSACSSLLVAFPAYPANLACSRMIQKYPQGSSCAEIGGTFTRKLTLILN